MSDRYKPYLVNRVWIVCDELTHEEAGGPFPTKDEADRYILELWRDAKPENAVSEPLNFEDAGELEEAILGIVDRIHGPIELWSGRKAA